MLKTLDILIGATVVLLLFSMAVTVITQAFTSFFDKRGKHLLAGLGSLLQQLGIESADTANKIAQAVLRHPAIAGAEGKLATVIHRSEFTKLVMDLASSKGAATLAGDAQTALQQMLKQNGVDDPGQVLGNIRKTVLQLESSNPEMASYVREDMAILKECSTDYVARIHSWFDQTMDRVSQAFARHAHRVTIAGAFIVVLVLQLDIIAVVDRLSIDDQFRNAVVSSAAKSLSDTATQASTNAYKIDTHSYYTLLGTAGLVTLPTNSEWFTQLKDPRKYPGMLIAVLLIGLGAPFWYNVLKDLIGLRSTLAQKDDQQRTQRQLGQAAADDSH
jgi:hypothetical protein